MDNLTQKLFELSWKETELIAAEVSKVNGSVFCSGIRRGVIDSITQGIDDLSDTRLSVLLAFSFKVNDTNVTIEKMILKIFWMLTGVNKQ